MVERTQRDIVAAYNRLIVKTDFDQITALTIAREAGISKATFYRYFKDKFDVMNYNYKALLDHSIRLKNCKSYKDLYCTLYRAGQTQLQNIRKSFNSTGINSFAYFIYRYSMNVVEQITRENRNGDGFTPLEAMQVDVFCYGISYMYQKWIFGQYDITAEEAAQALSDIMPKSLRDYWFIQVPQISKVI